MSDRATARLEAARQRLDLTHWDGQGCGTNGTGGCSRCYGPSPASASEVAKDVLAAAYEFDRANGYVTIRLDDALQDRLADSIGVYYGAPECRNPALAAAVLSALREAAETR